MDKTNKGIKKYINPIVFFPPSILLVIACFIGFFWPEKLGAAANAALEFTTDKFSWFYTLGTIILIVFCFWIAFSKFGKIRLGGPNAKPTMSTATWFAVTLVAGIAIGIVYYGVGEPMTYFMEPPGFLGIEGGTAEAGEQALRYTYLHWTVHTYAIFTCAGVCMAFAFYNSKRKFRVSSGLYPLLGEKVNGPIGNLIDALAIFTMVGSIGCSLGLGAMQLGDGFNYLNGSHYDSLILWVSIIAGFAVIYITSACTGLHRGITWLSHTNTVIFFGMMVFILLTGGTIFILDNSVSALGAYIGNFIEDAFYLEPLKQTGWVADWSVFYWAWWLSASLIIALFFVKLAKGRTIREFVFMNLLAPCLFGIAWFGIFGSSAINLQFHGADIYGPMTEYGIQVSIFALLNELPLSGITNIFAFIMVTISFVTLADSMTLTLSDMTKAEDREKAPIPLKIFWGTITGLLAIVLLISGGLNALQTATIVCGVPVLVVQLFMAYGMVKVVRNPEKYNLAYDDSEDVESDE